jgi:hypothetical protein
MTIRGPWISQAQPALSSLPHTITRKPRPKTHKTSSTTQVPASAARQSLHIQACCSTAHKFQEKRDLLTLLIHSNQVAGCAWPAATAAAPAAAATTLKLTGSRKSVTCCPCCCCCSPCALAAGMLAAASRGRHPPKPADACTGIRSTRRHSFVGCPAAGYSDKTKK